MVLFLWIRELNTPNITQSRECFPQGHNSKKPPRLPIADSPSGGILGLILMLTSTGRFSMVTSKEYLSISESIGSVAPSTDIGICVRLIARIVISSASRLRNMIKNTF